MLDGNNQNVWSDRIMCGVVRDCVVGNIHLYLYTYLQTAQQG